MKRLLSAVTLLFVALTPAVASAAAQKLLLTEVVVSVTPAEYVAIYNPGTTAIDLSDYYLADFETYYRVTMTSPPAVGTTDFVVRFPAGSLIQPGQTQYVQEILRDVGFLALAVWLIVRPRTLFAAERRLVTASTGSVTEGN